MKENWILWPLGRQKYVKRCFLGMRLTMYLLLLGTLHLAANTYSQNSSVSLNMHQVSLREVVEKLQKVTDYTFLYKNDLLNTGDRLNVNVKDREIREVLNEILSPRGLAFEIDDKVVVIRRQVMTQQQVEGIRIQGKVVDEKQISLPGVTVLVKGTDLGVTTDEQGKFQLQLPKSSQEVVLVFSFVGMKKKEVSWKGEAELKVVMAVEAAEMEEVVVTGIFERKKESFTGSASTFKGEQLKMVSNQNILSGLRSLDPAFAIIENNQYGSDPNRLPDIEIRGKSSIVGFKETFGEDPNQPLFILDGFETTLQTVMDLSMDRVASLTILKDAASTAIYGAKAANGVIVIETKTPEKGKLRLSYNGNFDVTMADLSDYNLMNAREKLEFEKLARKNEYTNSITAEKDKEYRYARIQAEIERGVDTYWLSEPLRVGFNHRHNLYAEGGDGQMRYGLGLSYNNTQGVMKGSGKEIVSGNIDLLYRVKNLIFSNKFSMDYRTNENPAVVFSEYAAANPYYRKRNENGEVEKWLENTKYSPTTGYEIIGETPVGNPLYNAALNNFDREKSTLFRNNFIIEWSIYNNLKLRGRIGITKSNSESETFLSPEHTQFEETDKLEKGSYRNTHMDDFSYESDFTVRYGCLLKEVHQLNVVGGTYIYAQQGNRKGFSAVGFPVGNYVTPSFANAYTPNSKPTYVGSIRRSASFYLNGGYAYNNRYLLDFNIRSDGSSVFGSNKRYTTTWAVGLAWNLYNEKFMAGASQLIDMLRFRASVGNPGNQNFGSFQTFTTYRFDNWLMNGFGTGVIIEGYGNPDLKWQKTLDKNVGMDLSMFGNRFHVTLDLYHKNTDPLLAVIGIPSSVGTSQMLTNIGRQVEKGINGTVKYSPLYRPEERKNYTISINFRTSKAEYAHIGNKLDQFNTENKSTNSTSLARYYDGGSPTALWSVRSAGIDPSSGKEVFVKKDGTYTFQYDYDEEVVVGNSRPKVEGVIGNTFYYKGFSCSLQLRYSLGGDVFNNALYSKVENISSEGLKTNQDKRALSQRWINPGDIAKYKDISLNEYTPISSRFVQKNNYLSIESVRLGYEFESKLVQRIGMSQLSLNAYMNDIARFSSIKSERGIDYPFARTLSISVSATF